MNNNRISQPMKNIRCWKIDHKWTNNVNLLFCDSSLHCFRFLTGQVDQRTIEKYEREAKEKNRESWYFAYIMDTNEEERAKVRFSNFIPINQNYRVKPLKWVAHALKPPIKDILFWMHLVTRTIFQI
jgi:hypothetical protein